MRFINKFIARESASGLILMAMAALALILANSPLQPWYQAALDYVPPIPLFGKNLSVLLWINDLLMAIFFLLVGLEIKREIALGELSNRRRAFLPLVAAVGGMALPALFYLGSTIAHPEYWAGWAIPSATDIAFSLAILALLGSRVPAALKVFLMALAIMDDLGAIVIIATFYNHGFDPIAFSAAVGCVFLLWLLNIRGVVLLWPYLVVGGLLWLAVLFSGIHATLAGVLTALFIPMRILHNLEHDLHPYVAFLILPLFALANSGLQLHGLPFEALLHPMTLGIILGLWLGKPLGIFGASYLFLRGERGRLPKDCGWHHLLGAACLGGIGFTMSLFIGSLAFPGAYINDVRLGVIAGSVLSALTGYGILRLK